MNAGFNNSQDSFGNLECSPPVTVNGKKYEFGRIVYGKGVQKMSPKVVKMMKAQQLQDPIEVDTSWLLVGHVDEFMSFLPMKNADKGFKILLAGPDLAWQILKNLQKNGDGDAELFKGITFSQDYTEVDMKCEYQQRTVNDIFNNYELCDAQKATQEKIDDVRNKLIPALGLSESDFIELPVLFHDKGGGSYIAYTPGVVNMLVFTNSRTSVKCCVPKPFGPIVNNKCQFEACIESALGPKNETGVELVFIDDFACYHVWDGEIHCGTNSRRVPTQTPFWWNMVP